MKRTLSKSVRWFASKTVREASYLAHRVRKIAKAQRDLLSPSALEKIHTALHDLEKTISENNDKQAILDRAKNLEQTANKWLKPYPHSGIRDNVDVLMVALVLALGIRTFFLQPMAIPTGSMQPTLYGITVENLKDQPSIEIPGRLKRIYRSLVFGISYYHVTARAAGRLTEIEPPKKLFPFVSKQRFRVGDTWYTIWFPPSTLPARETVPPEQLIVFHAGINPNKVFQPGEEIMKLKVISGDRLFVDRFTYHFRKPKRGEIVIFASQGIPGLQQDTHYIKRLIALGGERVRIGNDRHAVINGARLDASTPRFESIYSFHGPPRESQYSGHVNNTYADEVGRSLAPLFPDGNAELTVREDHFLVMGDNTLNSYDSRYWGDFPQQKVIGKFWFVFWPISPRFGWAVR